jgi:glycosyltransferase involved in cell wall biosynthesis
MIMEEKIFPKILIIGQTFHKMSGGGITISNLFYGWPKDKLAVASNVYLSSNIDVSICEQYYQLGYNGKLHPFPINVFLPKIKCGSISYKNVNGSEIKQGDNTINGKYKRIYKILSALLRFLGIFNVIYKLKITPEFKQWVTDFNPDIIYSQLSSLELIRFVSELNELTGKPIALHIMDDWPNTMYKPEMFFSYWRKVTDLEFRRLLDKSSILMSICDSMSEEYKIRYNKDFMPFHNPIDINFWLPFSKLQWETTGIFKILYSGRVGKANGKSILFMANIVNSMSIAGNKIELDIFTSDLTSRKAKVLRNLKGVNLKDTVPHNEMPALLASYDLLFLPLDFDKVGINFAQFSMPTKTSEYMISGTPVLVYADKRTALAQYAIRENWAYVVTENKKMPLIKALRELYSNLPLRKNLAEKAKKVAIQNDDTEVVRENFRHAFNLK